MPSHRIVRVVGFEAVGPFTLRLRFDDGAERTVDFGPVLEGEIFGALRDPGLFARATIDPEVHTLVWPSGADFDPATLYDWQTQGPQLAALARTWSGALASA